MTETITRKPPVGTKKGRTLAQLAALIEYPGGQYLADLAALCKSISEKCGDAAWSLDKFEHALLKITVQELQELYTRTFDLAALVSPYITGYIHGDENFDRGTLMAALGEKYEEIGFQVRGELPDHLRVLLEVSAWLDEETLGELIEFLLLKPIGQMVEQLKDTDNPYFNLLLAIEIVLKSE